jgi:hypothetical protein
MVVTKDHQHTVDLSADVGVWILMFRMRPKRSVELRTGFHPCEKQRQIYQRLPSASCPAGSQIRVINGGSAARESDHSCMRGPWVHGWHTWDAALLQSRSGSWTGLPFPPTPGVSWRVGCHLSAHHQHITRAFPKRHPRLPSLPIWPSPLSTLSLSFVQPHP